MALTLAEVVTGARLAHPRFTRDVCPDRALGEALGRAQRQMALSATRVNVTYLAQVMTVQFAMNTANLPSQVGAGTGGGLPAEEVGGNVDVVEQATGSGASFDLDNAVVAFGPFVPTSAAASTVTTTGAARTVNADAGRYAWIVDGLGAGPESLRSIASNTSTIWTLDDPWAIVPDTTSVIQIVDLTTQVDSREGVVTGLPAFGRSVSYLVKLDATGTPYLDLTTPLIAQFHTGIPLPPFDRILGGTCILTNTSATADGLTVPLNTGPFERDFTLIHYEGRTRPVRWPAGYTLGTDLFLIGQSSDWLDVQNLDLRYVPIPPLFPVDSTAMGTYFLLPDTAYDALVGVAEGVCARFAAAKGVTIDQAEIQGRADGALANWLKTVGRQQNAALRQARRNR